MPSSLLTRPIGVLPLTAPRGPPSCNRFLHFLSSFCRHCHIGTADLPSVATAILAPQNMSNAARLPFWHPNYRQPMIVFSQLTHQEGVATGINIWRAACIKGESRKQIRERPTGGRSAGASEDDFTVPFNRGP